MKKIMYLSICILALGFVACSKDDDGGSEKKCKDCAVLGITTTFCDNGDGTMTTTIADQSETTTIEEGTTFEEITNLACSSTITIGL